MTAPTLLQASSDQWHDYPELVHYNNINRDVRQYGPAKAFLCLAIASMIYADIHYFSILNTILYLPDVVDYVKYVICGALLVLCMGHFASLAYVHCVPECEIEHSRAQLLNISKDDIGFRVKPDAPVANVDSPPSNTDNFATASFRLPSDCELSREPVDDTWGDNSRQFRLFRLHGPGDNTTRLTDPFYDTAYRATIESNARAQDWHIDDLTSAEAFIRERNHETDPYLGCFSGTSYVQFETAGGNRPNYFADPGIEAIQRLYEVQPYRVASREVQEEVPFEAAIKTSLFTLRPAQLFLFNRNLRFWFHNEIFAPLTNKIREINANLSNCGYAPNYWIGVACLSELQHLTRIREEFTADIAAVIPFLELTANQEYLVSRYVDFCVGGALSKTNWDRGGPGWNEHLPSDAEILMFAFRTHIDVRLPPDPAFPDGRQFTNEHTRCWLDENQFAEHQAEGTFIHQRSRIPPYYSLQFGREMIDVGQGSANVFKAISVFLYYQMYENDWRICGYSMNADGLDVLKVIPE